MAINNVKNTQSLLADIEDWMNNPKFQPQEQNKWFFGEGLSYYTQLCEVVKVLTYLQDNFRIIIANEKSLEQAYNEVKDLPNQFNTLSTKVDDLTNTVSDLPTRVQELETKVTKLISDVSSQLTRIETLEGSVSTNTTDIATIKTDITNIKTKDSQQDSKIATLEGKDFLTNVRLENSNSVTFQGGEKVDGVQTYTAQVTGAVPVNLGENVAYASNNNTSILTNINSNVNINSPDTNNYHELVKTINIIRNGELIEENIPIAYFNKTYFSNNNNIFSLNINDIISGALLLDGSNILYEPVSNLNNFSTGIGLFSNVENRPFTNTFLVLSGSHVKNGALIQLAISYTGEMTYRSYDIDTKVWKNWSSLYVNNLTSTSTYKGLSATQGRILNEKITSETNRATDAESTLTTDLSTEVTRAKAKENELNTKFANYLLKSDAPGYDDILTNANATATYETKANASATYETKAHASTTYPTKTEMTNAINSAIGTAINANY